MMSLENRKESENLGLFEAIYALTAEYNDVYSLDLRTDHVTMIRFSGHAIGVKEQFAIKEEYDETMKVYILKNVLQEDQEMMFQRTKKEQIISELQRNKFYTVHYRVKRNNELHYMSMKCIRNGAADDFSSIIVGFANEDHLSESLSFLRAMEMDDLTGLYTQKAFYLRTERMLQQNPNVAYDMIFSDLENFKRINEKYGRSVGDEILKKVAEVLKRHQTKDVICGRYRSDQFVMIFAHDRECDFSKICEEIENEVPIKNLVVKYSLYPNVEHDLAASVLCDRMLIALHTIKGQYGKIFAQYDETLRKSEERQNQIQENMRKALEEEQFQIYYQPKYDVQANKFAGAEALVRWMHPQFGFLSPGEFIPLFEKNGFIKSLDWYVWDKVCADIAEWKAAGKKIYPISVNVSRRDFEQPEFAEKIIEIVDQYELDHSFLHLEITESCYAFNFETIVQVIQVLHNAGFVIELDDFGIGYSFLASLNKMPLDILKLDMSLIQKNDAPEEQDILSFAMQLAKILKMKIVQEGVETKEQMERVKAHGCDYVQGYYYSKPLSKQQFEKYLS